MQQYVDSKYWDARYRKHTGKTFDWLTNFASVRGVLDGIACDRSGKVLILGCGNSPFSEELYDYGYHDQINIDFSAEVVRQMSERGKSRPGLQYVVMDMQELAFSEEFFDLVIEKCTLDALFCGQEAAKRMSQVIREVWRVLKPRCHFLSISYGDPCARLQFYEREDWSVAVERPDSEESHFSYVCRKRGVAPR